MDAIDIKIRLRLAGLKRDLALLEEEIAQSPHINPRAERTSYRDFKGVLRGKLDVSEESLERARLKFDWAEETSSEEDK